MDNEKFLKDLLFDLRYHVEGISDESEIAWLKMFVIDIWRRKRNHL